MITDAYQILSALPYLPPLFRVAELPITPLLLEQRLKLMAPADKQRLERAQALLQPRDMQADEVMIPRLMQRVGNLESALLRRVFTDIFTFKRITLALLRRDNGAPAPLQHYAGEDAESGETRITPFDAVEGHLARNWSKPYLGYATSHAEIVPFADAMKSSEIYTAKRLRIEYIDKIIRAAAEEADFSVDGVILYVLQWMLIQEWLDNDGDAALAQVQGQVETLTERALKRVQLSAA